tara:strand:+ start:104 stop:502 length:399 start_codon:yes stop_codon:yes gene_type:complete
VINSQLLCTFTIKSKLSELVLDISKKYDIVFNKIYVLQNEDKPNELMCTYNVEINDNLDYNAIPNTISLHRKKHTNTLYTINALNEVIKNINNGVLDNKFPIPWENFQNTILVTNNEGLNKINTRIFEIIET